MNHDSFLSKTQAATNLTEPAPLHASMRLEIDHSLQVPFTILTRFSLLSLILGTVAALLCALKLVLPGCCDGFSFLTYGRLYPVAYDLFLYGWAIPGGFAVVLWLMARLSGAALGCRVVLTSAAFLWIAGVFSGSLALLAGYSTSVPFLEYPNWASFILFSAFLLMSVWVILLLRKRQPRALYVSQWYLLTSLVAFPWIYGSANMLLTWGKIEGSAQAPIQSWYAGSLLQLWLTPLALAIIYYIIPKITGKKIYSHYLALFGFFSLLLFAGWGGLSSLLGGPIPAWMTSAGVIANTLLLLPMLAIVINFSQMLRGEKQTMVESPALRCVVVAIISYVLATLLSFIGSIPCISGIVNFTQYTSGVFILTVFGFFGMSLFAALYYAIPRLTGISWSSAHHIRCHFWCALVGVGVMFLSLFLGGLIEGCALDDAVILFDNVISYATPWRWLVLISWFLLLVSFFSFVRLLILMRWKTIERRWPSPELNNF